MTFETYWAVLYTISLTLITVYEYYGGLRFPPGVWEMEIISILAFFLLQMMRLDFGKRANRNEHAFATGSFVVFTILCFLGYIGFGIATTYTLMIELGFMVFGVVLTGCEIVWGISAACRFKVKA